MSSHTVFIESKHDKTLLQLYASSLTKNTTAPAIIIAHPYGPLGTTHTCHCKPTLH